MCALPGIVVDALHSPAMKSVLLEKGAELGGGKSEAFGAFIRSETARFKRVIEAAGLRAEQPGECLDSVGARPRGGGG
jgi:tripartite-type tricarboxylate transporter receptor subunit TctC